MVKDFFFIFFISCTLKKMWWRLQCGLSQHFQGTSKVPWTKSGKSFSPGRKTFEEPGDEFFKWLKILLFQFRSIGMQLPISPKCKYMPLRLNFFDCMIKSLIQTSCYTDKNNFRKKVSRFLYLFLICEKSSLKMVVYLWWSESRMCCNNPLPRLIFTCYNKHKPEVLMKHEQHCGKSVLIRSFSGPYFTAFGLNTEIYGINFRIRSEYRKIRTI